MPDQDPFAGLTQVNPTAAAPSAPAEDPFKGLEEVSPSAATDSFAGLKPADNLDLQDESALAGDDSFRPAQFIAENPDVVNEPERFQKLLGVYRQKRVKGLDFGKVASAAVTEAPGIIAKTAKGAGQLVKRVVDIGVQPTVNEILGAVTGTNMGPLREETRKGQLKAAGEIAAGTEQAVTGLSQLGGQAARKLFGTAPDKLTDSQLYDQLLVDSEFHKQTNAIAQGQSDFSKSIGLDAEFLSKNGVALDPKVIENLSLVDPLTLVATAGVFKVVGVGGKVIATAATKLGAEAVLNGLQKVAAKSLQAAGKGAVVVGRVAQKAPLRTPSVAAIGGSLATGNVPAVIASAAAPAAVRATGRALAAGGQLVREAGEAIQPGFIGPRSAGITRLAEIAASPAAQAAKTVAKGAAGGAALAAPLALAADENQTAGAILGGGAALGAVAGAVGAGAKIGGRAVANVVAKKFFDPHSIPFEPIQSPGYGIDKALDATHDAAMQTLTPPEQNAVNNFREALRAQGGEIYVQDPQAYAERIRQALRDENGGAELTPEQEATAKAYADTHAEFDGFITDADGNQRRVVFLNGGAKGLPHDAGHLFQSLLSPERQGELRQAVLDSYNPKQLEEFGNAYTERLGDPEYFNKLGEEAGRNKIADEIIAENFSQLFGNTPLSDLKAPKGFLETLGRTAAEAGESLGLDLTGGRVTPDLQATPSVRLQNLLRNASHEVLNQPAVKEKLTLTKATAPEKIPTAEEIPSLPEAESLPPSKLPVLNEPEAAKIPAEPVVDVAAKRAQETGISEARELAKDNPEAAQAVEQISKSMEAGNPALRIEHRGITSEAPVGPRGEARGERRGTQESGYAELERLQVENRANAPESVVSVHEKTFVPVRWVNQGGKATLIAMSMDKILANIRKITEEAAAKKAENLIPYESVGGELTEKGWNDALADVKTYAENQSNGYRGDGQKLVRPSEEAGVSIPAENPNYTPKMLGEAQANFANLVQGIAPPKTARSVKGTIPGNVKAQLVAEANLRQPQPVASISAKDITKQTFAKPFESRTVKETNPLRNQLASKGVNVRALTEATERFAAQDIVSVGEAPAPAQMKAPVTDIIRGGFLPKDRPVSQTIESVESATPDEWAKTFGPQQSLTRSAFELGLNLKSPEDLVSLRDAQNRAQERGAEAMAKFKAGDQSAMDEVYAQATKGQFFREAYEAATDTGSAAGSYGWRKAFPEGKPPFAAQSLADRLHQEAFGYSQEKGAKFLPKTDSAKKFTDDGYNFEMGGGVGNRTLRVMKDGSEAARILSSQESPDVATIADVVVSKDLRGKGLGEAVYRELLNQLKDDGVKEVKGYVISEKPLGLRRKLFGEGATEVTDALDNPVPLQEAIDRIGQGEIGFQARSIISHDTKFLPPSPDKPIRDLAAEYAKTAKIPYKPTETYVPVNPKLAEKLADFYESAKSDPKDPAVQKSYQALADETLAQYKAMTDAGYTIEPYKGKGEPYKNSDEAIADIRDNKHLYFLKTEGNFAGGKDNPMLADSGIKIDGESLLVNDVFRAVHDFFGHGKEGYQFGPRGEFNAWRAHSEMYSPEAQGALAAETLAQNSWVNFGKHVRGKEIALKDRPFAEQKAVIVPDELIQEAKNGGEMQFLPKEKGPTTEEFLSERDSGKFLPRKKVGRKPDDIKEAAIKLSSGKVVGGYNHFAILKNLAEQGADTKGHSQGFVTDSGKFLNREEANDYAVRTGQLPEDASPGGSLDAYTFNDYRNFLPKRRKVEASDIQKRDEQGRPLTAEGLVDYEKLYAEKTKREKKQEAEDLKSIEGKYSMPENSAPEAGEATGWLLPNQEFVPLKAAFHEQFLADNAADLNKKFGTKFEDTADVGERLAALNSGFARVRYTPNTGGMNIEASASKWTPAAKRAVLDLLDKHADRIDNLRVTLLDESGVTHDTAGGNVSQLEGAEKISAMTDAVNGLKGATTERPKGVGPTDIQRARAFGQSSEPQFLPKEGPEEQYTVVWKPRAEGKTTFRQTVTATSVDDAKSQVIPKGGHFVRAFTEASVNEAAKEMISGGALKGIEEKARKEAGGSFLPKGGTKEFNDYVTERIKESKSVPEALPLDFRKDENGNYVAGFNGEPVMIAREYDLMGTPLAKASKEKTAAATEEKFTDALSKGLEREYKTAVKNPEVKAGETWYSTCREKLQTLLGDDTKLFAELLGATSPQTNVDVNFGFALDAYNQFKKGAYDKMLDKYREGKSAFANGELDEFTRETGKTGKKATYDAFMGWWVEKHKLIPAQSNGKRFGMNSRAVLRVLDGSWLQNVKGPKTPNFTGNLTGSTFEATIDVWAMRTMHRLANEGNPKRWRIQPGNETGVTDTDFFIGQKAFRKAADRLGIKPDALQAILWFNEKEHWTQKGWTKSIGKKKADFNVLLADTERTPEGRLKRVDKQLSFSDIEGKKNP